MSVPVRLEVERVRHRHPGADHDTPGETTFHLPAGGRALLVGPNGAGKTTLLLRLVGLLDGPGVVRIDGEVLRGAAVRRLRRRIGFLFQDPDDGLLLPTVLDDVALGPVNDGLPSDRARAVARDWLDRLGIPHLADREVARLSRGEKGLVALAGVLARDPGLLLLDEPTAALDEAARARLAAVLDVLPATVLLVTHDPAAWAGRTPAWSTIGLSTGPNTDAAVHPR